MVEVVWAARELAQAVDGVDWDAAWVESAVRQLNGAKRQADTAGLDAALQVLLDRLIRSRLDDADGVAHVAISAGSLVESGASARALGEVLLAKIPDVLRGARRYADRCLRQLPALDPDTYEDETDALAVVDDRVIPRDIFRAHLAEDRPGGCALVYLREWVLPTVAALTRDRELLRRAIADRELAVLAGAVANSEARRLDVLLGVQLEQVWTVLCPVQQRGFQVMLDGVVDNYTLHLLLAEALMPLGIPATANPADVVAYARGESDSRSTNHVKGSWNMYDYRAASLDLTDPTAAPLSMWVWGEGRPRDVPTLDGVRTLLIGPQRPSRTWNSPRTFHALPSSIQVIEELEPARVKSLLTRACKTA
jgi:hypothetical protein